MRDPETYLLKPDSEDLKKVFEYTNFQLNVGNFIIPAIKEGLIGEVVQIRGESDLQEYLGQTQGLPLQKDCRGEPCVHPGSSFHYSNIILDLDLDFFAPEMDYIDFDLAKKVILDIASKADCITIATSPYFIEQERAIEYLKKILT